MITGLIFIFLLMGGLLVYIAFDCIRMGRSIRKMKKQLKRL